MASNRSFSRRGISTGEPTGTFQIKAGNISTASTWKAGRIRRKKKNSLSAALAPCGLSTSTQLKGKSSTKFNPASTRFPPLFNPFKPVANLPAIERNSREAVVVQHSKCSRRRRIPKTRRFPVQNDVPRNPCRGENNFQKAPR